MVSSILDKVLQWPVIVQGALGSALFWLILTVGEILTKKLGVKVSGITKKQKLSRLNNEFVRYSTLATNDKFLISAGVVMLLYASLHYIVKALVMVCLGFIFSGVNYVFGIVGYVMALYYLFWAADAVRDTEKGIDPKQKVKELEDKIALLKKDS
jgi:hypothetical protein